MSIGFKLRLMTRETVVISVVVVSCFLFAACKENPGVLESPVAKKPPVAKESLEVKKPPVVKFILPNGYRGKFSIFIDSEVGVDVKLTSGAYTYRIPPNGMLYVKSNFPFNHWYSPYAVFESGEIILVAMHPTDYPDIAVAIRSLKGTTPELSWIIGTKQDWLDARD